MSDINNYKPNQVEFWCEVGAWMVIIPITAIMLGTLAFVLSGIALLPRWAQIAVVVWPFLALAITLFDNRKRKGTFSDE